MEIFVAEQVTNEQDRKHLNFVADKMNSKNFIVFELVRIQPNWYKELWHYRMVYSLVFGFAYGSIIGFAFGVTIGWAVGLSIWASIGLLFGWFSNYLNSSGSIPLRVVTFMDRMSDQHILEDTRRTIKGKKIRRATWRFRHKILQEYFAKLGSKA